MFEEIFLAVIQAATEFLPVSSSGHLALVSNLISEPNLFFITILHFASLLAVLIFTRKEIYKLVSFEKNYRKMWLYLIIATIPAALIGFFFKSQIESSLSSFLFIGISFLFTSFILFMSKFANRSSKLNSRSSLFVGLFQVFALFPGVSRSGMTISSSLISGIKKEEAVRFSLLLFIPLALGAMILELGEFYFSIELGIAFVLCFVLSLLFLNLLMYITKKGYFWAFGFYTLVLGIISLVLA